MRLGKRLPRSETDWLTCDLGCDMETSAHCQDRRICDDPADMPGTCAGLRPPATDSDSYQAQACARRMPEDDLLSYSLVTHTLTTVPECMVICDADPKCEGFEFGPRILNGRS
jgi:hypothetical protein